MEKNAWLQSKTNLIGPFVRIAKPEIVEMLAMAGYDFGVIDLEHGGAVNMNEVYPLILAAENKGLKLIARIPGVNETYIKWLLDLGIGGLQIPHIKTKEDAQRAIEFSKFHPMGERGLCRFVRASEFSNIPKEEYILEANAKSIIILQIEGVEGAKNIEEICSVEGIDVIFVGPYDLSQSMGLTGQIWHPDVAKEITRIINICQKKGIETGVFTDTPEGIKHWSELGVKYLNYRIDTELFFDFAKKSKAEVNAFLK
ncbi:MAG: aldolase [Bacteroidetes bacterium]|jgi:4-hydroxy-2-oxoheptanedioate aldolase|nr:aldolase [Bacteroidota bacterium]MDF2452058.1 aldolase [Bacteroidota bacterium]